MINNKSKKHIFVFWSGGIDSTAIIYKYLNEGHKVTAGYIKMLNNEIKTKMELDAIDKLEEKFKYFKNFKYSGILSEGVAKNVLCGRDKGVMFRQLPFLLFNIMYIIGEYDEIALGFIRNSDINPWIPDIQKIYRSLFGVCHDDDTDKKTKLVFPFYKIGKQEIVNLVPKEIFELTVTCEYPKEISKGKFKECGNCEQCKTIIKYRYLHNNNKKVIREVVDLECQIQSKSLIKKRTKTNTKKLKRK